MEASANGNEYSIAVHMECIATFGPVMYPVTLWQRLAAPLLLCFVLSLLPSSIFFNGPDRVATECAESPAPTGEEEAVKHARPFAILYQGHSDPGSPLIELAHTTDDRLLPSPHGEVLLRPPKRLL